MKTQDTNTELSLNVLRRLALMQHLSEDYFLDNGIAYEGNLDEFVTEWVELSENSENGISWADFIKENCSEVQELDIEDCYDVDYYVLTDSEADEKATEYIKDSLWAFNADFLAEQTDMPVEVFEAIRDNGRCESNNDAIERIINKTTDIKSFVKSAISADGRGHFLSSYDGNENEETVQDETFYIYRIN